MALYRQEALPGAQGMPSYTKAVPVGVPSLYTPAGYDLDSSCLISPELLDDVENNERRLVLLLAGSHPNEAFDPANAPNCGKNGTAV